MSRPSRLLSLAVAAACVAPTTGRTAPPAAGPTATPGPVIGRLVMRHQAIVIRSGPAEPTYSLETRGGDVLVAPSTARELARTNPALLGTVHSMQTAVLWAGVSE